MQLRIRDEHLNEAERLIRDFRQMAVQLFGSSVESFSLHGLAHLPHQIKLFGGLWNVSCSMFESAFYHLKKLVTGTRNEGQLLVKRFLQQMSVLNPVNEPQKCDAFSFGDSKAIVDVSIYSAYEFDACASDRAAFRFQSRDNGFHSQDYRKKLSSASYFALLKDNRFVRIDHIVCREEAILCLCTELRKSCSILDKIGLPVNNTLRNDCNTFVVEYGCKCICDANLFQRHLILVCVSELLFATPVLDRLEHE